MKAVRNAAGYVLVALLCTAPVPATADTLQDILDVSVTVGLIDQDVANSRPVIECLLGGGTVTTCVDVVTLAKGEAQSMLPPTDSKIKLMVDLVNAVRDERWLEVVQLGGASGIQMACALVPGGIIRDFFCKGIAEATQDKIEAVYGAFVDGDWWKLLTLADPDIVCPLLPSEIRTVVCSGILAAIDDIVEFLGNGLDAVGSAFESLGAWLGGQDDPPDPKKFYLDYFRFPELHGQVYQLLLGGQTGGMLNLKYKFCVGYFDSRKMSESDAESICTAMRNQLSSEAKQIAPFAASLVEGYYTARLEGLRYEVTAANWAELDENHSGPTPHTAGDIEWQYSLCAKAVSDMLKLPPLDDSWKGVHGNVIGWICDESVGNLFTQALVDTRAEFQQSILPGMSTCTVEQNGPYPDLYVRCSSYESWRQCRETFRGYGLDPGVPASNHCSINNSVASVGLANQIASQLGSKRCSVNGNAVVCTREWKQQECLIRVGEVIAGLPAPTPPSCVLMPDANYEAAKQEARTILNGWNQIGAFDIGPGGRAIPTTTVEMDKLCRTLVDPLALRCNDNAIAARPVADGVLPYCPPDPNNDGADQPCYAGLADANLKPAEATPLTGAATNTVTPGSPETAGGRQRPAMAQPIGSQPLPDPTNPRGSGLAAPPSPCSMEVTYYVPQPPIIEASASTVEVGDQLNVRCDYTSVTETIEWPVCDDRARNKMASLANSQTSGSRYSGVLTVDGLNMGVTTSPPDLSSFSGKGTMMYRDVGSHEVGCQIDNGLNYVVANTETYLRQVVSHRIGARTDLDRTRRFDPTNVVQVVTELLEAQIEPLPAGSLARLRPATHEGTLMPRQ